MMAWEDEKELAGRLVDAILAEDLQEVRRLVKDVGGNPSTLGPRGLAPLHAAASLADPGPLRVLLVSGSYLNPRSDPDLATPLMVAAAWGRAPVLRELLRAGADPYLADLEGMTTWDYAAGHIECLEILEKAVDDAWKSRACDPPLGTTYEIGPCNSSLDKSSTSDVVQSLGRTEDTYGTAEPLGCSTVRDLPLSDPRVKVETWLGSGRTWSRDPPISEAGSREEVRRDNASQTPKGCSSCHELDVHENRCGWDVGSCCRRLESYSCSDSVHGCMKSCGNFATPRRHLSCCCRWHVPCRPSPHCLSALRCCSFCGSPCSGAPIRLQSCYSASVRTPTNQAAARPEIVLDKSYPKQEESMKCRNDEVNELCHSMTQDLTLGSVYESPNASSLCYNCLDEAFIWPNVEVNDCTSSAEQVHPESPGGRSTAPENDLYETPHNTMSCGNSPECSLSVCINGAGDVSSRNVCISCSPKSSHNRSGNELERLGDLGITCRPRKSLSRSSREDLVISSSPSKSKQVILTEDHVFKTPSATKKIKHRRRPKIADPAYESDSDSSISLCLANRVKACSDCNSVASSVCSIVPKYENSSTCDTEDLRGEIIRLWGQCGPLTKTTKPVYRRLYKRLAGLPIDVKEKKLYSSELLTACGPNGDVCLAKWSSFESDMMRSFESSKRRVGSKVFFNYLLLEPVTASSFLEFLDAIFYVGKGKSDRPYAHLHEALKPDGNASKKVQRIRHVWDSGHGIVCLQAFHNIGSPEAFSREAAMIDALTLAGLTNAKKGEYHGLATTWCLRDKCRLGSVLLNRCWHVYRAQANRQIYKDDL